MCKTYTLLWLYVFICLDSAYNSFGEFLYFRIKVVLLMKAVRNVLHIVVY